VQTCALPINSVTWQMYYGGTITSSYSNVCYVTWNVSTSGALGAIVYDSYNTPHQIQKYVTINATTPSTPPAPTVQSTNCGSTVIARSAPPTGITYYWQSSASGTSTSNSSATITKTGSGTQYLRARNTGGTWSTSSSSVSYTVNAVPATPPAPSVSGNCGSTVLTRGTPPSGHTYYWQSSSGGTSTADSGGSEDRRGGSGGTY